MLALLINVLCVQNSYVRAEQKAAPIDLAALVLPESLLDNLGIVRIPPDDVLMKPKLLRL